VGFGRLSADRIVLPSASELPLSTQALYHASALGDYALRTGFGTAVAAAMIPRSFTLNGRIERRRLEFYAELTALRDPRHVFLPPPTEVKIRIEPGRGPGGPGGHVELVRFASPYVPLNPDVRRAYLAHERNATARAQHWRHDDGPRPTLMVIHGFGASPAWFNTLFFSLREFFADGWDVVLFTMPFHGGRRGPNALFNGVELFTGGYAQLNEAILQAVCDLQVMLGHLRRQGAPRVGVTGLSLGGYMSAVLASVEPRLDFAIPNATVASVPAVIGQWFPANLGHALLGRIKGIPATLMEDALNVHSPLLYEPLLPRHRLMVVAGLGDRLTPPEHSLMLWKHWGKPQLRWFPGSHILHFERGAYLAAMRELIATPRLEPRAVAA
jgi:pimeloyl-ACP methyl ester carboxylesterase